MLSSSTRASSGCRLGSECAADAHYPFLFYGTDWLAFGHVVIALAFIGPLRNPWRNRWVVEWGILACVLVIPWALVFGPLRGIPFFWRLIDTSFGFGGLALLLPAYRLIGKTAADYELRVTG